MIFLKEIKKIKSFINKKNKEIISSNYKPSHIIQSPPIYNLDKIIIQNNENYEIINNTSPSVNSLKYDNGKINKYYSDIQDIDWNNIEDFQILNARDPLILVTIFNVCYGTHNQVLIKSSNSMAQDVYASALEIILKHPILEMRLIDHEEEFTTLSSNLIRISKLKSSENILLFIENEIKKSFFQVMEYKPNGSFFNELNHKEYFSNNKNGNKKLKQLGQLIAFDLICNVNNNICGSSKSKNSKLNHNNSYFAKIFSNLIFYEQPDSKGWYFKITNSSSSFSNNSLFSTEYRNTIHSMKLLLFTIYQNRETSQIHQLKKYLSNNFNINLPTDSSKYIQKGISRGINEIVKSLSYQVLTETKEIVKNMVSIETNQNNINWKKSLNSIYCSFLLDVLKEIVIENSNFKN